MSRTFRILRWSLFGAWAVAAAVAVLLTMPAGLGALGFPPERVTFLPAMITGLPWSGPLFLTDLDAVTTLAVALVANLLNLGLGLLLARGED